jgi:hypothetical protein
VTADLLPPGRREGVSPPGRREGRRGQSSLLTQVAAFGLQIGDAAPTANSIRGSDLSLDEPRRIGGRRFFPIPRAVLGRVAGGKMRKQKGHVEILSFTKA